VIVTLATKLSRGLIGLLAGGVLLLQAPGAWAQGAGQAGPTVEVHDGSIQTPKLRLNVEKAARRRCSPKPAFELAASAEYGSKRLFFEGGSVTSDCNQAFSLRAFTTLDNKRGTGLKNRELVFRGELYPNTPGSNLYSGLLYEVTGNPRDKGTKSIKVFDLVVGELGRTR